MLSLSFSLRRTEDKPTSRPPEVQTGFGREMPSLAPYAFVLATPRAHRQSPRPLILFLTRRGRVDQASRSQAGTRSSYSSGSLSQRKIYVNRHVDTCSNVTGARARAERSEEGTWEEAWKSGYWYAVSDFAVFPGESEGGSRREERTPRDAM